MSPSNEIRVGAFVIASAALLLGGVIVLGSGKFFHDTEIIETSFKESVDGLQVGGPVKYRGVPIGEISLITFADRLYPNAERDEPEFDYGSAVVVRMKVRIDVFGPDQSELFTKDIERGVEKGLRARMRSAGLTGGSFIELDMVDLALVQTPNVRPIAHPDYPYIPSASSMMNEVMETLQRVASGLETLDISGIGAGLKKAVDTTNSMLEGRGATILTKVEGFMDDLRESNRYLQKVLADPKLQSMLSDGSALAKDLRESLPDAVSRYSELAEQLNSTLAGSDYDIQRLIRALRETAENLESLTERADLDPPQLLFAKPPQKLAPGQSAP
jgi:paraquat-inducible protein B